MTEPQPTSYWDYIRVEDLLSLQSGLEGGTEPLDNEEVLFITVHQVFELWFKLVLRELASARDLFTRETVAEQELSGVSKRLQRVATIFRTATTHFEVVETLNTRAYLEFRRKLMPASGFQSAQMRQVEILFGLEEADRIPMGPPGGHMDSLRNKDGSESPSYRRVAEQLADVPTLKDAIDTWLERTPIDGVPHDSPHAEESLKGFIERYLDAHGGEVDASCEHACALVDADPDRERLRQMYAVEKKSIEEFLNPSPESGGAVRRRIRTAILFIETYRELPLLAWPRTILASLINVEQAFLIFRQRHARMVERVIGRRTGTGGSAGVDYLDKTALEYRIFRDLWAVRTLMIRPGATPPLENPDFYGFKSGS